MPPARSGSLLSNSSSVALPGATTGASRLVILSVADESDHDTPVHTACSAREPFTHTSLGEIDEPSLSRLQPFVSFTRGVKLSHVASLHQWSGDRGIVSG